jgi:hypothetical protein
MDFLVLTYFFIQSPVNKPIRRFMISSTINSITRSYTKNYLQSAKLAYARRKVTTSTPSTYNAAKKILASGIIWGALGFATSRGNRLKGTVGGGLVGTAYGASVVGLTHLVKGPGAAAPFYIWGPMLLATGILLGSCAEVDPSYLNITINDQGINLNNKIIVDEKGLNVNGKIIVNENGVVIKDK